MKRIMLFCLSIILLLSQYAHATSQNPDGLIYNDKTYLVWRFTLSDEMNENKEIFFKKPKNRDKMIVTTANWDSINVSLIIKDSKLYITKIDLDMDNYEILGKPSYEDIFGVNIPEQGLFADWYSGELITEFYSWHMGALSTRFFFKNGVLKEIKRGF